MLVIGIPKELKNKENRVAIIPSDVRSLSLQGIRVIVQSGAGEGSGFSDASYEQAGAEMRPSLGDVYAQADIICKVKEPISKEYEYLKNGQAIFSFLHLSSPDHCGLVRLLCEKNITALAFETLEKDGKIPILAPMSRIAGGLSIGYANYFNNCFLKSKESMGQLTYPAGFFRELKKIADYFPEVESQSNPLSTVIWGGGIAGQEAIRIGRLLGHRIIIIETRAEVRNKIAHDFGSDGLKIISPDQVGNQNLDNADILIGCVHSRGQRAMQVISESTLSFISKKKQKIIMDISIDQGGNFPFARATTYEDPLYKDLYGNIRFGVTNIPAFCGNFASTQISALCVPYLSLLAQGIDSAINQSAELRSALNTAKGKVLNDEVKKAHDL